MRRQNRQNKNVCFFHCYLFEKQAKWLRICSKHVKPVKKIRPKKKKGDRKNVKDKIKRLHIESARDYFM